MLSSSSKNLNFNSEIRTRMDRITMDGANQDSGCGLAREAVRAGSVRASATGILARRKSVAAAAVKLVRRISTVT